jgi:hypothetical protein
MKLRHALLLLLYVFLFGILFMDLRVWRPG